MERKSTPGMSEATSESSGPSLEERVKSVRESLKIVNIFENIAEAAKVEAGFQKLEELACEPLTQAQRARAESLLHELDIFRYAVKEKMAKDPNWSLPSRDLNSTTSIEMVLSILAGVNSLAREVRGTAREGDKQSIAEA